MSPLLGKDTMFHDRYVERTIHLPRRILRESIMVIDMIQFFLINRFGRNSVTEPGGPVVSLTTYGKRIGMVHYAIESIARGSIRPSRLILWLDDEALIQNLPAPIRRLQKRGLEVKSCKNFGCHKKYYPYVESQQTFDVPLATADDDILYPRDWLKRLVEANREYPGAVNCYRARMMAMDENGIGKYLDWKHCNSTTMSFRHISLGCMGAIYPPLFLLALKRAGTDFETCCPKGDDLWLHVQALRAGFKVRQILPQLPYFAFQAIPGTERSSLSHENVTYGDGNDCQIRATYTESDIQVLRAGCDTSSH